MLMSELVFQENREIFVSFANASSELIPLFHQPWWLDLTCEGESWSAVCAMDGDSLVAYLVLLPKRFLGLQLAIQPPEVFFAGPIILPSDNDENKIQNKERQILEGFASALEKFVFYQQYWHHTIRDWSPFYWKGYRQTSRYTYQLRNTADLQATFDGFSSNILRLIRKAKDSEQIVLDYSVPVSDFLQLNRTTYSRQRKPYPHDDQVLERLFSAGRKKGLLHIVGVRDHTGHLVAANVYGVDAFTLYYLQGASTDSGRRSGAVALCFSEGIKMSASLGLVFDFEGSMIRGVEKYIRTFGAEQVEYFAVSRLNTPSVWKISALIKETVRKLF